jgi:hypothetical protein
MAASARRKLVKTPPSSAPDPLDFFGELRWIDGRPLCDTLEPYRRQILADVLGTLGDDGAPQYNMALCGRAKKNWKTADLSLAAIFRFLAWPSAAGNDAFLIANDEGQAADDLSLVKKLFAVNPALNRRVNILSKEIARLDGRGVLRILPARDVAGAHGKTYIFLGFDEIHAYRSHDLFEALAPDPTRNDALIWITSYAGIRHAPGVPLFDFMQAGKRGDDPRMYFSWYGGDYTTDPALVDATPEERANPSAASWGNPGYLDQQRRRLPTHKFRRLHLNLPGSPDGAAFDGDKVMAAIVNGRQRLTYAAANAYFAFVDMSGGSNDDATLAIAHVDSASKRTVLDVLMSQIGAPPFNPRDAVRRFAAELKAWGLSRVTGDAYAGQTFRADFEALGVTYAVSSKSKSELYDAFEPKLNAGEVELLDHAKLTEQLLTLVLRGGRIDHLPNDHDDHANAACGAIVIAGGDTVPFTGMLIHWQRMAEGYAEAERAVPDDELIALQAKPWAEFCGARGRQYRADDFGVVRVEPEDAKALLRAGYVEVSREEKAS